VIRPPLGTNPDCVIPNGLSFWGHDDGSSGTPPQRKIVMWIRSQLNENDLGASYLPDPDDPDGDDEELALGEIAEFGYRYGRCFDYLQVGNEVFGGAGGYKFRKSDFDSNTCSTCTECDTSGWSNDAKGFDQLDSDCQSEAAEMLLDWLGKMAEAAIEGSALAGRPIRIVGPGLTLGSVNAGAGSVNRDVTVATADWCNERIAYFDLHAHYVGKQALKDAIDRLDGTDVPSNGDWTVPELRCSLEWGPKLDDSETWWMNNSDTFDDFFEEDPVADPGTTWEDFVAAWEDNSDQFDLPLPAGFDLAGLLSDFDTGTFSLVCYGPTIQDDPQDAQFDIAAIWANQVVENWILDDDKFSPLYDDYESAVGGSSPSYVISDFTPHPDSCDCPE